MVEAIAAGCRPGLPDRLSYRWLIPPEHHENVLYQGGLGPSLKEALTDQPQLDGLAGSMTRFSWDALAPVYDAQIEKLARV